jgi:dCTP deaminase
MSLVPKDRTASGPNGVLPDSSLWGLIEAGQISADSPIDANQVQPNSIDLRLGAVAHRTRCSFLPVGDTVEALLHDLATNRTELDGDGFVMECGQTYIIPLMERLTLPPGIYGYTNPKSSTGRLDIMVRVLTDGGDMFDTVPAGYQGSLYLEVISRSFPVRLRAGDTLAQLRIFQGADVTLSDDELRKMIDGRFIVRDHDGVPIPASSLGIDDGVFLSVDLGGKDRTIGYRSKRCTKVVDFRARGLPIRHFWEHMAAPSRRSDPLILDPNAFYIFASRERVVVPPDVCAEMVAIDVRSGEVRTHYAGFFDSGFGFDDAERNSVGARVVLEVRNMDVPFLLQDGQKLFRLRFFRNTATPTRLYGQSLASNYQGQGLKLAKQFAQESSQKPQLEMHWDPNATSEKRPPVEGRLVTLLGGQRD